MPQSPLLDRTRRIFCVWNLYYQQWSTCAYARITHVVSILSCVGRFLIWTFCRGGGLFNPLFPISNCWLIVEHLQCTCIFATFFSPLLEKAKCLIHYQWIQRNKSFFEVYSGAYLGRSQSREAHHQVNRKAWLSFFKFKFLTKVKNWKSKHCGTMQVYLGKSDSLT